MRVQIKIQKNHCQNEVADNFVPSVHASVLVGHRDLKSLMSYYRKSAAEIAKKLD